MTHLIIKLLKFLITVIVWSLMLSVVLSHDAVWIPEGRGTETIRQYYDRTVTSWGITWDAALRLAILGYAIHRTENGQQPNNLRGITYWRNSAHYCVMTKRSRYCTFRTRKEWYLTRLNVWVAGWFDVSNLCASARIYKYGSRGKKINCKKDVWIKNVTHFLYHYWSAYVIPSILPSPTTWEILTGTMDTSGGMMGLPSATGSVSTSQ